MGRLGIIGAVIGAQLLAGAAMAGERCRPRHLAVADLPGLEVGTNYKDARAQIPKANRCSATQSDGCEFVDRWGYLNVFGEVMDGDRYLYARFARRERHPPLPYGVTWSDNPARVTKKLKALGLSPSTPGAAGVVVSVVGCFRGEIGDGFWSEFRFDKTGRLTEMKRAGLYPCSRRPPIEKGVIQTLPLLVKQVSGG